MKVLARCAPPRACGWYGVHAVVSGAPALWEKPVCPSCRDNALLEIRAGDDPMWRVEALRQHAARALDLRVIGRRGARSTAFGVRGRDGWFTITDAFEDDAVGGLDYLLGTLLARVARLAL